MLPYFLVLVVLASYGIHRYALVYNFFKYKHHVPGPPPPVTEWPKVTIQLPIFNERYVIERLVGLRRAIRLSARPAGDSGARRFHRRNAASRARIASSAISSSAFRFPTCTATIAKGFKAGALQEGLKSATGEFIAIFDADFLPPPDFLRRTLPYFTDPKLAMVQTRWTYINRDYSALTEVEAILLDGHFVIEHSARYRRGQFLQFQWHGGRVAPRRDRRCGRLAARHADRRHRSFLSRAAPRLEISLSAGHRVPVGVAGGDERVQIAAGALGQGLDADREKNSAARAALGCARARQEPRPSFTSPRTSAIR